MIEITHDSKVDIYRGRYINIEKYKVVETSVYNIPERLKEIDPSYFVMFNRFTGNYEVHSTANKGRNTYCLSVPYAELDCRTLDLVNRTRIANMDKLIKEMELANSKRLVDADNEFRDTVGEISKDMWEYGQREDMTHKYFYK
ncbi:MAG: hypothetical protein SFH39_00340 [Candidatus Magnetobacterium sp. LHC-1]